MAKNKDSVSLYGVMVESIEDSGKMVNKTDVESLYLRTETKELVFGAMEKKFVGLIDTFAVVSYFSL